LRIIRTDAKPASSGDALKNRLALVGAMVTSEAPRLRAFRCSLCHAFVNRRAAKASLIIHLTRGSLTVPANQREHPLIEMETVSMHDKNFYAR
jgi:hypothetical protein